MLTRTHLLAGAAALVALSLVGPAAAQAPIKLGELNSYKAFPAFLEPYKKGWELAVEEVNAAGGVLGRKLEVVSRDDNGNPGDAVRVAEELLSREGAAFLIGTFPSHIGLAVADFAKQRKVLFIAAEPLSDKIVWDNGNAYTFRLRPSTYMQTAMLVPDAAKLDRKRWAIVYPNYEYGQSATQAFKTLLSARQPSVEFVTEQATPLGKIDAGAVAQALADAKPDAIFSSLFGPDLAKFVREGQQRGLFKGVEVFNLLAGEPEYLDPLKEEAPDGWYVTGYPWSEIKTPEHARFLAAYQAKYKDYPRLGSVVGYSTIFSAVEAINKAGSLDQGKLVAAMSGLRVPTPFGTVEYRPIDHQSTMGAYVGRIGVRDGKGYMKEWRFVDGKDVLPSDAEVKKMRPAVRMTFASILIQLLNGLAAASSLFLVSAGLSLIFGVTRIVNFAHGSLYMLGLYGAYSLIEALGRTPIGFWSAVVLAALAVGLAGIVIEVLVLRRIYRAPELFQLLATFAVVLVIKDIALFAWGAEDLVGPRAPGLSGAVEIFDRRIPAYDLLLIAVGPLVLIAMSLLLARTRWGALVRAATQDREMVGALGVDQARLFTSVFFVGAVLAGLGGALQIPREPANLELDLAVIADAFVVTVVGGLGSIGGAFLAAVMIGVAKAFCIGIGTVQWFGAEIVFSKLTLVVEFLIMALVLIVRPFGLLGRPQATQRLAADPAPPLTVPSSAFALVWLVLLLLVPLLADRYVTILLSDILCFALFAVSLHFIMGPAGMVSFGHAAYFGLGAYAAGLLLKRAGLPMEAALVLAPLAAGAFAVVYGWFCVRLSGVYLAMLTLAFAQITWSIVFQWGSLTGGSNGLFGVWPSAWLADKTIYYYLVLLFCGAGIALLWRFLFSPFGYALRAGRDSPLRAEAVGIDVRGFQWLAFVLAGVMAGLAGAVYAFSKGSIAPSTISIGQSTDGLVMVLLGGVETLTGPVAGAAVFTWLRDEVARHTEFWRAVIGAVILLIVLLFPQGLVGGLKALTLRWREAQS